jgi:heavy metal sensor kinase
MKQLSIKARVTLWYTCCMLAVVALVLFTIFSLRNLMQYFSEKELLTQTVDSSLENVELDDGQLEIEEEFSFLQDSVYLSFYSADGIPLYGRVPKDFDSSLAFLENTVQEVTAGTVTWLVYDRTLTLDGTQTFWARGIIAQEEHRTPLQTVLYLTLIALPLLVLLAAGVGYLITRKAFQPVAQIVSAAEQISSGDDLTKRISLGPGEDEIHTLAQAFDHMFDRLEQSFNAERQFTSDASHELRTPVAIILSQCEYALAHAETMEETRKALAVNQEQAQRMSALLNQLLFLARVDQGRQPIQMEQIDLSEIAAVVAEETRIAAGEKQISIETDLQPNLVLYADETLMMRFFMNLLSNAVTYGHEGGHIWFSLHATQNAIFGEVRDDGIGIRTEALPLIWNRFYQADPARSSPTSSGLGLSMVRWIAELHHGTISVESTPGVGSRFYFTFPIHSDTTPQ